MIVYTAMKTLADQGYEGSVSFPLPGSKFCCIIRMGITPDAGVGLFLQMIGNGVSKVTEAHHTEEIELMKDYLRDKSNEEEIRFKIKQLWDQIPKKKKKV